MGLMNRLGAAHNSYQNIDKYKRVLCVCSAGCLRSPTAAVVLSQHPFNFNTRAAGLETDYAIIPVDDVLLSWADEVVCMEKWQAEEVEVMLDVADLDKNPPVICLDIPDRFAYRDPELVKMISDNYQKQTKVYK